jgi:hypothetical protein
VLSDTVSEAFFSLFQIGCCWVVNATVLYLVSVSHPHVCLSALANSLVIKSRMSRVYYPPVPPALEVRSFSVLPADASELESNRAGQYPKDKSGPTAPWSEAATAVLDIRHAGSIPSIVYYDSRALSQTAVGQDVWTYGTMNAPTMYLRGGAQPAAQRARQTVG